MISTFKLILEASLNIKGKKKWDHPKCVQGIDSNCKCRGSNKSFSDQPD